MSTDSIVSDEEALGARQHRIDRRKSVGRKRALESDDEEYVEEDENQTSTKKARIPFSSIRGIKKQARYEPEIPMTKKELAVWRKEARRVRNRESAAASRRKIRDRIEELEEQVQAVQCKYSEALQRIAELEGQSSVLPHPTVSPVLSPTSINILEDTPSWSLSNQQAAKDLAASLSYNLDAYNTAEEIHEQPQQQKTKQQPPLPPITISRPTAV